MIHPKVCPKSNVHSFGSGCNFIIGEAKHGGQAFIIAINNSTGRELIARHQYMAWRKRFVRWKNLSDKVFFAINAKDCKRYNLCMVAAQECYDLAHKWMDWENIPYKEICPELYK